MREVKINGIYKHFKGDYYLVEDIAKKLRNRRRNGSIQKVI